MAYYITCGNLQHYLSEYYFRTGSRMQFPEMIDYLYQKNLLSDAKPHTVPVSRLFGISDTDTMDKIIDQLVLTLFPHCTANKTICENDIIPPSKDVFIIRHLKYTRHAPQSHNYVEINYVVDGSCTFYW